MAYPYYGGFGPTLVECIWALFAIATILVCLRVVVKATIVKEGGGWPLLWILVSYALALVSTVLYDRAAHYGLGNHTEISATAPRLVDALLFEWIAANLINFSSFFGRLSVAAFIFDVQGRTYPNRKLVIIFLMGVLLILYTITIAMIYTQCTPARKLWDQAVPGNCNGINRAFYFAIFVGAWGSFTDIVLALYPAFLIYDLRIKLRLKLIYCALMGLGLFAGVANIVKTSQFGRLRATLDPIYAIAPLMMWGAIEMWVIIIAASAAPLWPLVKATKQQTQAVRSKYFGHRRVSKQHAKAGDQVLNGQGPPVRLESNADSQRVLVSKPGAIEMRTQWSVDSEKAPSEGEELHGQNIINGAPSGSYIAEVKTNL